jgi:salicylate hydroxylase
MDTLTSLLPLNSRRKLRFRRANSNNERVQMSEKASSGKRIRAAVVGGGIGGLSAACSLRRRGIDVTVFEQAEALGEIGAGLIIFPNALRLLERMRLGEALAAVGARIGEGSQYYRADGSVVGSIITTDSNGWNGIYGMHRADLLNVLAANLPSGTVRTGHRCTGLEQNAIAAQLKFANGESAEADIVIAADGIHSTLQQYVVEPKPPEYSGVRAYRGLVVREKLPGWREEAHQIWMGEGKHFMVYPLRSGRLLNYVGFVPTADATIESWSAVGDRDELAASFAGWDPRVVRFLEAVEACFWWGLYDRSPLKSWTKGRLVLLGDAAHAMLPHLGQGANQAIEDGLALSVLLEGRDPGEVPDILPRYENLRRVRTDLIQAEARKNGLRYDSRYASLAQRDHEVANAGVFRKSLYDYDVEKAAIAGASETGRRS